MVQDIDIKTLVYKEFDGYNLFEPQYDIHRSPDEDQPSRSPSPPNRPQFSLAGNHLPVTHKTAVIETKPKNETIWSLAKPLPRVAGEKLGDE